MTTLAMTNRLFSHFSGDGLKARALRGIWMTLVGLAGRGGLRLVSNLILTRLLFPEAFGLMALVAVAMSGITMFSDIGVGAAIIQSKNGDKTEFLNTTWTLQIIRGVVLCLLCALVGFPMAYIYDEPLLISVMPVMGLIPLISGFASTNLASANRDLRLGWMTTQNLIGQVIGLIGTIALAFALRSVWALILGGMISNIVVVIFSHTVLPGIRNRLCWHRETLTEVFGFGRFLMFNTIATYVLSRSDKAILGAYISLKLLGVYSIGSLLGVLPSQILKTMFRRVVFPLYSRRPPRESAANQRNLFRARRMLVACAMLGNMILAVGGVWLVSTLYDSRYALAGPAVVLICLSMVPVIATEGYDSALMSYGDTRRMFFLKGTTAVLQLALMAVGIHWFGIFGAIVAPGLASLIIYPMVIRYVRPYAVWDPVADFGFLGTGLLVCGLSCWIYWAEVVKLMV